MKLIVSGGSGLVATEIIRQSLLTPKITSLVVLSRRPITVPNNTDASKLKQVLIKYYEHYSDDVRTQLAGADACIWTVAITPSKSRTYAWEEVRRVCQTCTLAGLKAITDAGTREPFRFVYMSGDGAHGEPKFMADYLNLRFETDQMVRSFLKEQPGQNEACIARSGLITSRATALRAVWGPLVSWTNVVLNITVEEVSAAMIDGVLNGFEAETLQSEDLKRIGKRALETSGHEQY